MTSEDRPDLKKPRNGPRPAAAAGRDPVDTPPPTESSVSPPPEAKVLRQFRLSPAEDELLRWAQQQRGDRNLIDTVRWLISMSPGLLAGDYDIEPRETT